MTLAERGAARYLGVFFSFEGVEGKPWAEQDAYTQRVATPSSHGWRSWNPHRGNTRRSCAACS